MIIGLLEASCSLPEASSLKNKRQVIRSLKDRTLARMNVSIAEIGKQDYWKSAEFAFVTVANQRDVVDKRLQEVSNMLQTTPGLILLDYHIELL